MNTELKQRLKVFTNKDRQARLWMSLCILSTAAYSFICLDLVKHAHQQREYIVVGDETIFVTSPIEFGKAEELHQQQSIAAMETLFNRHPGGFDQPGRLEKLFEADAFDKAATALASDREEFKSKHIHQKVEIESITITQVKKNAMMASLTGQLIRAGQFDGVPYTEVLNVKTHFSFIENLSLTKSRSYPTLVTDFTYKTEPIQHP